MFMNALIGVWLFTGLIFQGQDMPLPNPDLQIHYQFEEGGTNVLSYHRIGEQGFCERRAIYEFDGNTLIQQVTWLNPNNAPWCGQDPDMQIGYKSWSKAWLSEGKFHLSVMMGEDNLIYVWDRSEFVGRSLH